MKVLLIDDDPDDAFLFKDAIETLPGNVEFLHIDQCDGLLAYLDKDTINMIIIDINLPKINGIDCLKMIRGEPGFSGTPIIMYSTAMNQHYIDSCFQQGADHFFVKPNTFSALVTVIEKLMNIDWKSRAVPSRSEFVIQ